MKYLVEISYVGDSFSGFQYQNDERTVQGELTRIFTELFDVQTKITGCSRTDSGVHANSFFITAEPAAEGANEIPADKLPLAVSHLMPSDLSVISARTVSDDFHVRYNVKSKEYLYRLYISDTPDPFLYKRAWQLRTQVTDSDIYKMREAAKYIIGKHDFTSFMAQGSKIVDATRTVYSLDIEKNGRFIDVRISADGFLYNMVRIIVGTLVDVLFGRTQPGDIMPIIEAKNRALAGFTAPPYGLYLNSVVY